VAFVFVARRLLKKFWQSQEAGLGGIVARRATIKYQHRDFVQNRFEVF